MHTRRRAAAARLALGLLFAVYVAESGFFLLHGRFNIDEGMHLNAGRLVFEAGELPYRDFPFSQGPGGPFLYGAVGEIFGWSLAAGRAASAALGLLCAGAMAWLAQRIEGTAAALIVLAFAIVGFPALWMFTQIRTEPASVCLATLATIAFCFRDRSTLHRAAAPTLLVWATAFRLTYAVPLLAVCLWIGLELRRAPRALLATAAIVGANGLVAALPLLAHPADSVFHILVAQTGRAERMGWPDFPFWARFWFLRQPETSFRAVLLLSAVPLWMIVDRWRRGWRPWRSDPLDEASVMSVALGMGLLTYLPLLFFELGFFQYFVNASLLFTLAIAVAVPAFARRSRSHALATWSLVGVAWLLTGFTALRHAELWMDPNAPTVGRLAEVRQRLRSLAPGGCEMLTFETHLATETGCRVTPGLEYSYFSFFPTVSDADARRHGVKNRHLLAEHLTREPPEFVALTRKAVERISGAPSDPTRAPLLPGMEGRYLPLLQLDLPIGPIYDFQAEVFVYARSDLVALE